MSMQSRRDLFQAHRLMTQRASLALLRGEPDVPDQPLRRLNVSTFAGVLVAVIGLGVFFIVGLLFHGSAPLVDEKGTLVINKQTGTNYVFCESGHDLCPVLNYASARLLLGSPSPTVQPVNQSEIATFPQGPTLGIPGLPQDLPAQRQLVQQPWSVCAQTSVVAGQGRQTTTTLAGGIPVGGQPLGGSLLAVQAQGQDWAIWNNERRPITGVTLQDVFPGVQPASVPLVWLNAMPQRSAFQAPTIPGRGALAPAPGGGQARVGQTYTVTTAGSTQYYVLVEGGRLAPVTQLQDLLLTFLPGAPPAQALAASAVTGNVTAALPTGGLPPTKPTAATVDPQAPFCAVYSGSTPANTPASAGKAGAAPTLTMQVETGGAVPANGVPTGALPGSGFVDAVVLPPAAGALVKENSISYFLITDGRRYPMASSAVPSYLGYATSQAVKLPASVVDLVPPGPGLNPAQAQDTVSGG